MKENEPLVIGEQSPAKQKIRLDYLDFAKCIAIILVIWGHTTGNFDRPAYRIVLYSFHMPLFFLVSGVVISRHQHAYDRAHWKAFLFKNVMALLVPYLIWGAIYSNFSYKNFGMLFYGSWQVINASGNVLTSLWYLPCLFAARVLAEAVLMISWNFKKLERHLFAAIVAVFAFAAGLLLPRIAIGYPFCLDVAFTALGFILVGYATKELLLGLCEKSAWIHVAGMAVFGGLLAYGQLCQGENAYLMLMCQSDYGNIPLFFLNSFAGIGLVLSASLLLTKLFENHGDSKVRGFLLWTGKNTIGIFLLHKPFMWQIAIPCLEWFGVQLPSAFWGFVATIIAFLYSAAVVWVVNRYVPSLFGRFPKKAAPENH